MRLNQLRLNNFRNLDQAELHPAPGLNWLYGENGAGKTSVLEGIHLLARGRSFRSRNSKSLIQDGASELVVFARGNEPEATLGMSRSRDSWLGRINGQPCKRVSEFAQALPLILVEPSNHELVQGGPELRRAFMDWGLFHVEHSYLRAWRRYSRLLQQRNAALKTNAPDAMLDALESPMNDAAVAVDRARTDYVAALRTELRLLHQELDWRFSEIQLVYPPSQESQNYLSGWKDNRARDREQGYTRAGPHRADLKIISNKRLAAPRLSRGQQKLTALMLLLAQLRVALRAGAKPLLLLDDPISELDEPHLQRLFAWIAECPVQVWVTAVEPPKGLDAKMFHVERGAVISQPGQ